MLFENCSLLLGRDIGRDIGLASGPLSIGKQLRNFLFQDVRLLGS